MSLGLGCRTGSLFLYGFLSTFVWILFILSSFLAHYSVATPHQDAYSRIASRLAVGLRRTGKVIASLNAVWIVVACTFQVTRFYDRCYCNSSYLGLGAMAYDVIGWTPDDVYTVKAVSAIGMMMSAGSALIFWLWVCYSRRSGKASD